MATKDTATKRDPKKWAAAKARAKRKMGGKHSARAMQLAVKYSKILVELIAVRKSLLISFQSGASKNGKPNRENHLAKREKDTYRRKQSNPCRQRNMQRPPKQREKGLLQGSSS